jgi:DNA-binding NarL/FixJ family response regulator
MRSGIAAGDDVRILLVDDQPHFLGAAQQVIDVAPGFRIVGTAASGEAVLAWLRSQRADLVLMDVRMPGGSGPLAARKIAELEHPPVIVLCSSEDRPDIRADPAAYGAHAYCSKDRFSVSLLHELWALHGAARQPG